MYIKRKKKVCIFYKKKEKMNTFTLKTELTLEEIKEALKEVEEKVMIEVKEEESYLHHKDPEENIESVYESLDIKRFVEALFALVKSRKNEA
jgi:Na+-transporting NADH:ubiquinone oxidoreductase subunit NqrA